MSNSSGLILLDFNDRATAGQWQAIDDRIMGGNSQSNPEFIADTGLRFSGKISLENNGGFASIRSNHKMHDLHRFSGIRLRYRGDGKTYKISLRTDHFFDGVSYQKAFTTEDNIWQEASLRFSSFTPTHHGISLSTVAPMDTGSITSFGLFIADRQEGPFKLDLAWIKAEE